MTFKIEEFITIRGLYFERINKTFLYQLSPGKTRLFIHITRIKNFEFKKLNPIIKAPLLRLGKKDISDIINLPGIKAKKYFILQVKRKKREDSSKRGLTKDNRGLLLY